MTRTVATNIVGCHVVAHRAERTHELTLVRRQQHGLRAGAAIPGVARPHARLERARVDDAWEPRGEHRADDSLLAWMVRDTGADDPRGRTGKPFDGVGVRVDDRLRPTRQHQVLRTARPHVSDHACARRGRAARAQDRCTGIRVRAGDDPEHAPRVLVVAVAGARPEAGDLLDAGRVVCIHDPSVAQAWKNVRMAFRDIRVTGDPVLRTPCEPINEIDDRVRQLVEDLVETVDYDGRAGLAANQIGVSLRAFSWNIDGDIGYIINPVITENSDELQELGEEGCLSVPGLWYPCERPAYAKAEGIDLDGNPVTIEGEEIWARLINHECDHLDGHLYLDRLAKDVRKRAMRELRESLEKA